MPASRPLLLGAATNWLAFVATMAAGFLMAPYYLRQLGDARYGVWCVVESVLAYFTLFDLGIAACLVRYVARHHAAGEHDELNRIVSAGVVVYTAAAGCVLALGGGVVPLVAPSLQRHLGGPGDDVAAFMFLMLANLAVTLPLSVFPSILDGLQRFGVKSGVRLGFLLAKVGGAVAVLETTPGLLSLGLVFTAVNLLEHAALAGLVVRFLPGLRVSWRRVDGATLRRVRGYSVDAFLAMLAGRITVQTGAVVVGGFLTAAAAAHYALAARLIETAKNLFRSVTTTLAPAVSEREAGGDLEGVRRVYLVATRAVLYLVLPVQLGLLFFGRPFLDRWVGGPAYADWCYPAAAVLSATVAIGTAQSVASRVLYGLGRLRLLARAALLEAAANLTLSLALVGPWGIEGVAAAVVAPNLLFCLFVIGYTNRLLGVGTIPYLTGAWLRPAAVAGLPAAIWACNGPAEATWAGIAGGIVMGLVPYGLAAAAIEFGPRFESARGVSRTPRPTVPPVLPG